MKVGIGRAKSSRDEEETLNRPRRNSMAEGRDARDRIETAGREGIKKDNASRAI